MKLGWGHGWGIQEELEAGSRDSYDHNTLYKCMMYSEI